MSIVVAVVVKFLGCKVFHNTCTPLIAVFYKKQEPVVLKLVMVVVLVLSRFNCLVRTLNKNIELLS